MVTQGITYPQLTDTQGISRVVVEHRGAYEILGPFGAHEAILETASRQMADDPTDYPAVGDWVIHTLEPIDNRRVGIIGVLPRRSRVLGVLRDRRPYLKLWAPTSTFSHWLSLLIKK